MRRCATILLPLLLTLGCATVQTTGQPRPPAPAPAPPAAPSAAAVPLEELGDDVRWVVSSAEYRALAWQTFAFATRRVEELAAGREPGTWAVSLDADETILNNAQYEIERHGNPVEFDRESWKAWVARREATAVPGARQFLARVRALGGRVVIVTNRRLDEAADTAANLEALELPYDLLLPRTAESDKEGRWEAVAAGTAASGVPPLEILLWVGDNIGDFPHLDQSLAQAPEEALTPFGDRYVVLPNPMYGSWKD